MAGGGQPPKDLREALGALLLDAGGSQPKKNYAFWQTQPVAQFDEALESAEVTIINFDHMPDGHTCRELG